MKAFFHILFVLDVFMIAALTWSMLQPTVKPDETRLILIFTGLLGLAWYLRNKSPKMALTIVALPLASPILVWVFLAAIFLLASVTE